MAFKLDDYVDVADRITQFYKKWPDGRLKTRDVRYCEWPVGGILATAEAYRTPDDPHPGVGTAWEPVPGKTPYTKDSEVQNAETAAWGRAIVACGISTKKIASRQEVEARQESPRPVVDAAPGGASLPPAPVEGEPSEDERAAAQRSTIDLREGALAKLATPAQRKKMFAMAGEYGLQEGDVKDIIRQVAGVESSKDIPRALMQRIYDEIELTAKAAPQ